jgi:hypothetical protein
MMVLADVTSGAASTVPTVPRDTAIKAWAEKQDDQPALATAICRLVELGLKAQAK